MAVSAGAAAGRATFTRGRRLAIGVNVLIASLLAPLVAGLLLYLAFRPELRRRVDLTSRGTFTLAERTLKVLEELAAPVEVYTVFQPIAINDAGVPSPGFEAIVQVVALHANDVLREFEVRSRGKLRAHAYDPNFTGHFGRIQELKAKIGENPLNVVVVESGERRRVLKLPDLAAYDAGTQTTTALTRPSLHGFRDEESLVRALLSVTEERPVRIGFLRGHGERDPAAAGLDASGRAGLSFWRRGLEAQNYVLAGIDLTSAGELSKDDVDVLVIADPLKPVGEREVEAILRYARGGGALALLLGPEAANSLDFPVVSELLGLSRHVHPVCQVTTFGNLKFEPNVFFTDERSCSDHPIVRPLKSRRMRLFWKDVVASAPTGRADHSEIVRDPLVWTGKDAWEDRPDAQHNYNHEFDPESEEKSPMPLVLAHAVVPKDAGRAVLIGCPDVLDDGNIESAPGNRDFGLNVIDWLTHREQLISIAAKPYDVVDVDLTPKESNAIFLYVVAGVPALALLLGIAVYWMRRN